MPPFERFWASGSLQIPSWSDKLAGEVIRLMLEAYCEPSFSGHSHGFQKGRDAASRVAMAFAQCWHAIAGTLNRSCYG